MKGKRTVKARLLLMLPVLLMLLGACRVRTSPEASGGRDGPQAGTVSAGQEPPPEGAPAAEAAEGEPEAADSGEKSRENPESDRKEYDETADTEVIPGASHRAVGEETGSFAGTGNPEAEQRESQLDDGAEKSATRTVTAGEAERLGVAEDAKTAETAADYYRVLLEDRLGTLMECKRLNVYWETAAEWRTVYRTSPEHRMILAAGCYDAAGRLTEERLQVDAGWVARKNPDVIIRVAPAGVLGSGVYTADAAKDLREEMLRREGWSGIRAVQEGRLALIAPEMTEAPHLRLAAELLIARTAYPELFGDLDVEEALKALAEEATGSIPDAVFFYDGRE